MMKFEKWGALIVIALVFFAYYYQVDITAIMLAIIIGSIFEYALNKK